jgi:hypothetical protein
VCRNFFSFKLADEQVACIFVPLLTILGLEQKFVSARRSEVRVPTPPWVTWVTVALIVVVTSLSPRIIESRWVVAAGGIALAFAFGYQRGTRKRADSIWLGIYLSGLSVSLLWWPGGPYARSGTFGICAGAGFIAVGLARLWHFHFPTDGHDGTM